MMFWNNYGEAPNHEPYVWRMTSFETPGGNKINLILLQNHPQTPN
jgi:hypothetical protein